MIEQLQAAVDVAIDLRWVLLVAVGGFAVAGLFVHLTPAPGALGEERPGAGNTPEGGVLDSTPLPRSPVTAPRSEVDLYWHPSPGNLWDFIDRRLGELVERWIREMS